MPTHFQLQIPSSELRQYQVRYPFAPESKLDQLREVRIKLGFLTLDQLCEICEWRSSRRAALARMNSPALVREITAFAFAAKCEESRIGALTILRGIGFPAASVILHFCVDQTYPILGVHTLWSLGIKKPPMPYTIDFWIEYVDFCRRLAAQYGLTVRELDQALWQFSAEHPPKDSRIDEDD